MDRKERVRLIVGITINIIVFALAVFCLCDFIKYIIRGNSDNRFRYYTNISNLTVGFIAFINAIMFTISLIKGRVIYPKFLSIVKFIGLSMVALTFFTVLFILAPLTSYVEMYRKVRFITHLVIPVLAIVSYLFFEEKSFFEWKFSLLGFLPPVIYAIVYAVNAIFLKTWPDIYKINTQGIWYIYAANICIFGFALAEGLYFLKKAVLKKQ